MKVLITGGAGFIGSALARRLASLTHSVVVLDTLSEQIHGVGASFPSGLQDCAQCVRGDVRDHDLLGSLIADVDAVVHLAAETGTGQSMYALRRYESVNLGGTATLLDLLANARPKALQKVIVASSRAIYGEGQYHCAVHGVVSPGSRRVEDMKNGLFEPRCPICDGEAYPQPTREAAPLSPSSFYGLTKQVQEQMVLMTAAAVGVHAVALRYQNVYGPGQSLSNPYTGILAIFANLARRGHTINVFEDGKESRDFVYIDDVVEVTAACLDERVSGTVSLNVGSGVSTSVHDVARAVVEHFSSPSAIEISGNFRVGDIRHGSADLTLLREITGLKPRTQFRDGLANFLKWAQQAEPVDINFERSIEELRSRNLIHAGNA